MVANTTWFAPHLSKWREELELSIRSEALKRVLQAAEDTESKYQWEANKYLLQGSWKPSEGKSAVGRPTKARIKEEANKLFAISKDFEDDYKRIKGVN